MPEPTQVQRLSRRLQRQPLRPGGRPAPRGPWWQVPHPRLSLALGLGLLVSSVPSLAGEGGLPRTVVLLWAGSGLGQLLLGAAGLVPRRRLR